MEFSSVGSLNMLVINGVKVFSNLAHWLTHILKRGLKNAVSSCYFSSAAFSKFAVILLLVFLELAHRHDYVLRFVYKRYNQPNPERRVQNAACLLARYCWVLPALPTLAQ